MLLLKALVGSRISHVTPPSDHTRHVTTAGLQCDVTGSQGRHTCFHCMTLSVYTCWGPWFCGSLLGLWSDILLLLPAVLRLNCSAAEPTHCPAAPSDSLLTNYGTWASDCAGQPIGHECIASCPGGSDSPVKVTCQKVAGQPAGQYNTTSLGTCNPVVCSGTPAANLLDNYGTWNSSCGGTTAPGTCSANCPGGGSATVNCRTDGNGWNTTVQGACDPVFCTSTPSATLTNDGSWPSACTAGSGTAAEDLCTATCPGGGTATVKCEGSTANWNTTVVGECLPQCTTPPPADLNSLGTWDGCTGAFNITQTCNATCTYGGSAMVTCESSGNWSSTAEGKCLAQCTAGALPALTNTGSPADSWGSCTTSLEGTVCSATCAGDGAGTPVNTTCGSDGQWGATSGTCPQICAANPTDTTTLTYSGAYTDAAACVGTVVNGVCEASCTDGGGTQAVTCQASGNWSTPSVIVSGTCNP
jgi:hypothetical protein